MKTLEVVRSADQSKVGIRVLDGDREMTALLSPAEAREFAAQLSAAADTAGSAKKTGRK